MSGSFANLADLCRSHRPVAALVLGSGLNQVTDSWPILESVRFSELPGMPNAGVAGHRGQLVLQEWAGRRLLVFQGRLHFYEGYDAPVVAQPVKLAQELGVSMLWLTNAAGGIGAGQEAGRLMVVEAHLNLMRSGWWPDVTPCRVYSPRLTSLLSESAERVGVPSGRGVYAGVLGPNYETPAEVRALRMLGADAVGMSTVHEAETAAVSGIEVAAISCIANRAAGLSATRLSHGDVLRAVREAADGLGRLIEFALTQI